MEKARIAWKSQVQEGKQDIEILLVDPEKGYKDLLWGGLGLEFWVSPGHTEMWSFDYKASELHPTSAYPLREWSRALKPEECLAQAILWYSEEPI